MSLTCERCGVPVAVNPDRNPDARLLRRSLSSGVCVNCAMTVFLKTMEPLATVLRAKGPEVLLVPAAQAQAARMLAASDADADPSELDWQGIVERWDLEAPRG